MLCHPDSALEASNNEVYVGSALCSAVSHGNCTLQMEPARLKNAWFFISMFHTVRDCQKSPNLERASESSALPAAGDDRAKVGLATQE